MLAGCVQKWKMAPARCDCERARPKESRCRAHRYAAGMPRWATRRRLRRISAAPVRPSPLDLFALKEALSLGLKARAETAVEEAAHPFVPSKVLMTTNLGRGLASSLKDLGRKVLPSIGQRVVVAEAVAHGLTVASTPEFAAHEEFAN